MRARCFFGFYKHTVGLLKWQMRWACNTFVDLDEMIRLGSVPWIRGKGIVTYSNLVAQIVVCLAVNRGH